MGDEPDRRQAILDAAFEEFSTKGFQGATIKSIARAARVRSPALLYWYFPTKEDLFQAVLGQHAPILQVVLDPGSLRDRPPEEVLPLLARAYLATADTVANQRLLRLLMSEALHARAPYKGVLTHGFTVDEKGRKMSKSLGNVVLPQKVMATLGADVLRLWVASTDYANEIGVSDEILKRTADSYRRMRNTVRFLLGNLHGFDPALDQVAPADLVALDAWAIARTRELQAEIITAYREYAFHLIYQKVHNFCIVDLGGLYLDVLKDRLYTTPAKSHARRSAQTAMFHIVEAMVRWLAPILSFTAEEIWQYLPGKRGESVQCEVWHALPEVPASAIDWPALLALRAAVTRELEKLRDTGAIGAPLEAQVDVWCVPAEYPRHAALGDELRFLLITSAARIHEGAPPPDSVPVAEGVAVRVAPTTATKCVRCWHRLEDVGLRAEHPELCGRCVTNVTGAGETRRYA